MKTAVIFVSLCLAILFVYPVQVVAQIVFSEHTIAPDFGRAFSVYAADIDGDGDMDVLGAAGTADDITWWENDGEQDFTEHTIADNFLGAYSVYAADIDSDDDMDVLGAGTGVDDITWWENDGEQDFTEHTIAPDFADASSVYAADIDGDGDMDVLGAASSPGHDITWWENDGEQDFTEHTIADNFLGAISVYAVDIDGDGDMDVLGGAMHEGTTWWENDGDQDFTEHTVSGDFFVTWSVHAADIDGDDDMDVMGAAVGLDDITWWENDGEQEFTEHIIAPDFDGAISVYAADIDGDGDMDVLGAAGVADDITWWEYDGEQDFTEHTIAGNFEGAWSVYAADVDNDGDMDVIGAAAWADDITWWENLGTPPDEFELVSPEDEETVEDDTVTVYWTSSSDDNEFQYVVEWSIFEEFPQDSTIIESTNDTFFVLTEVLELDEFPDDITIYWRVKAIDESGLYRWANDDDEGWSFDICIPEPPAPFNLISPPDGFELINNSDFPLVFRWESTTDPDPGDSIIYIIFELSTDIEFIDNVYTVEAVDSVSLDSIEIDSYWWRVRVFDTFDLSTVSEVRSLSVTLPVGEKYTTDIPTEYSIVSAYPNPFNPLLSVVIAIPEKSELSVKIVNIIGEEVVSLANGSYTPGYHKFAFDAAKMSSGIYFIHANVPGKMNEVRKVVLMK
ncbi:MAG: FG-GAP-like repeat-containing protein [Candidatus Electryonea clarkiae]|nr:FG-GAP-like repeat-containing protein [Candidatus Electryonea clarkiae]MDP8286151.1 FG-GAP-like repeat-containing protein [Candidatus Electryonea clarkiae]